MAVTWALIHRPVTDSHRHLTQIKAICPAEVAAEVVPAAEEMVEVVVAVWVVEVTILAARRIMWIAQPSTHDRRPSNRCRTAIWFRLSFPPVNYNTISFLYLFFTGQMFWECQVWHTQKKREKVESPNHLFIIDLLLFRFTFFEFLFRHLNLQKPNQRGI